MPKDQRQQKKKKIERDQNNCNLPIKKTVTENDRGSQKKTIGTNKKMKGNKSRVKARVGRIKTEIQTERSTCDLTYKHMKLPPNQVT